MKQDMQQAFQEGELYVFQHGELRHLERSANDLPKVLISKLAHTRLLELRRRSRKALGGFRPDIALVASALLEHSASTNEAESVVASYYFVTAAQHASSLPSATGSDDAPKSLIPLTEHGSGGSDGTK